MIKFDYNEPLFNVVVTSKEDILTASGDDLTNNAPGDHGSGQIPDPFTLPAG